MSLGLSASRLAAWRQCPRRLWLQEHRPELQEAAHGLVRSQAIGHEGKEVARALFAGGVLIDQEAGSQAVLQATREAIRLAQDRPVYEVTFAHNQVLVRVDILQPSPGVYPLIEVASSTGATPHHLEDCALQAWVLERNGLALRSIELAHIDTGFTYQEGGWYGGLFQQVSMDAAVRPPPPGMAQQVAPTRAGLPGPEPRPPSARSARVPSHARSNTTAAQRMREPVHRCIRWICGAACARPCVNSSGVMASPAPCRGGSTA